MKIPLTKLKSWNDKKRLQEIHDLVSDVHEDESLPQWVSDSMDEVLQILTYWKHHMKVNVETPKKKKSKKEVNLW